SSSVSSFGNVEQTVDVLAQPTSSSEIRLGTLVGIKIPAGALTRPTTISVKHLDAIEVPPLDPGLVNVTAPKGHGYAFLPHGQLFAKPAEVIVPFDAALLPEGMTTGDITTYFFDPIAGAWKPLTRGAIDVGDSTVHSATNHFTVMINAVLAVPTD